MILKFRTDAIAKLERQLKKGQQQQQPPEDDSKDKEIVCFYCVPLLCTFSALFKLLQLQTEFSHDKEIEECLFMRLLHDLIHLRIPYTPKLHTQNLYKNQLQPYKDFSISNFF